MTATKHFVRLQAFLEAPSKHAAVRSKLVANVVSRMVPQKWQISAGRSRLVALPNWFPIREDGGNDNGQSRS